MAPKITTEIPCLVYKVPAEQVTGDCSGNCCADTTDNSPPFFFILSMKLIFPLSRWAVMKVRLLGQNPKSVTLVPYSIIPFVEF